MNPGIDYETKMARLECLNRYCTILLGDEPERQLIKIPLTSNRIPSNGLFLGEQIINANISVKRVLELGAGKYAPASFIILSAYSGISVDAVEIQGKEVKYLQGLIELNQLQKRFHIFAGNLFEPVAGLKYDLIYSNIAQLPLISDHKPNCHDHGGVDGWKWLTQIIELPPSSINLGGYLALMVFDFLGIEDRANQSTQSLKERLENAGFKIIKKSAYRRELRIGGQTHQALNHILRLYPGAKFYDQDSLRVDPNKGIKDGRSVFFDFQFVLAQHNQKPDPTSY
ncbi:MAG: methyltransferase [Candidatus Omnitrophota bacterium]